MSGVRILTDDEKEKIRQERLDKERARHPRAKITVHVRDKTNDKGEPQVEVQMLTPMGGPPPDMRKK